jgi:hypothetical protein
LRCLDPALFRPPAEQYHQGVAVLAEVDAISGSEVDSVLEHAGPDALHVREIPQFQPPHGRGDLCGGDGVERGEPVSERTRTVALEELQNRQHGYGNI